MTYNGGIEVKYDEQRDSFYIDCGSIDNLNYLLNLITYAMEHLNNKRKTTKQNENNPS